MTNTLDEAVKAEEQYLAVFAGEVREAFSEVRSDLLFLATNNELLAFLENDTSEVRTQLQDEYLFFSKSKGTYSQIRLLDEEGMEVARVDRKGSKSYIVSTEDLQHKGERPYFKEARNLEQGRIYLSGFDLNQERGVIEFPLSPVIRFATPVYRSDRTFAGVVVLNYRGNLLLDAITDLSVGGGEFQTVLLNSSGGYLKSFDEDSAFSFLLPGKENPQFDEGFPEVWKQIRSGEQGVVTTPEGVFVFQTISNPLAIEGRLRDSRLGISGSPTESVALENWKLAGRMLTGDLRVSLIRRYGLFALVLIAISGFLSAFLTNLRQKLHISERQRMEAMDELQVANSELEKRNWDLSLLNQRLDSRNREMSHQAHLLRKAITTKDKFFSIISHDLRSPFTGILGYSELMIERGDSYTPAEFVKGAQGIHSSASSILNLLENLLHWARSESGGLSSSPSKQCLAETVDETLGILSTVARSKGIQVASSIPSKLEAVYDENVVSTVIRNLVSNALKFTPKGGTVHVKATAQNGVLLVSVEDTGVGMSEEQLVDAFSVSQTESRKGTDGERGSGLGLYLCHDLIERSGGKIWATSPPGKGSIFTFTLPLQPPS